MNEIKKIKWTSICQWIYCERVEENESWKNIQKPFIDWSNELFKKPAQFVSFLADKSLLMIFCLLSVWKNTKRFGEEVFKILVKILN